VHRHPISGDRAPAVTMIGWHGTALGCRWRGRRLIHVSPPPPRFNMLPVLPWKRKCLRQLTETGSVIHVTRKSVPCIWTRSGKSLVAVPAAEDLTSHCPCHTCGDTSACDKNVTILCILRNKTPKTVNNVYLWVHVCVEFGWKSAIGYINFGKTA